MFSWGNFRGHAVDFFSFFVVRFRGQVAPNCVPICTNFCFETCIRGPQDGPRGPFLRFENASSNALACGKVFLQEMASKVAVLRAVSIKKLESVSVRVFFN